MSPDLSVVIPTFRRPQLLSETLGSVLAQPGVKLEVIVVDDSPEGSAREVVARLRDPRVAYLNNPTPTGGVPSIVRNLGWPRARGGLIHFLDDDDIVPDRHYAEVMAAFAERPNVGVIFGRVEPFGDAPPAQLAGEKQFFAEAARRASSCNRFGSRWGFAARMMFDRAMFICSAAIVRRDSVMQTGGFDPSIRLREDVDFYARVIRRFGAHFMDRVSIRYRIGSPSLMHAPKLAEEDIRDIERGRRRTQSRFRSEQGAAEYYILKLFAKTVLRMV
jgi:glycosyltransferase involved in cell wall biosynthesis